MEILEERVNEFLGRREVSFKVFHQRAGTPKREEVKTALSAKLGIPLENIFIVDLQTQSGLNETLGEAFIFPENVRIDVIEPRLRRHLKAEKAEDQGGK